MSLLSMLVVDKGQAESCFVPLSPFKVTDAHISLKHFATREGKALVAGNSQERPGTDLLTPLDSTPCNRSR
jgi:hypothetical protein